MNRLINVIWFQVGWWSLLLSAQIGKSILGLAISVILLGLHFVLLSNNKKRDMCLAHP